MGIKFNRHWFLLVFISVEIQDQFGRLYFISISYQFHSTGVFDMYVTLFRFRCNVDFTSIFCGCSSVSRLGNVNFCRSDWIGVVIFLRSYTEKINSNALFFICAYASYLIHVSTFVWIYSIPHLRVCLCVCVNVCVCDCWTRVCVCVSSCECICACSWWSCACVYAAPRSGRSPAPPSASRRSSRRRNASGAQLAPHTQPILLYPSPDARLIFAVSPPQTPDLIFARFINMCLDFMLLICDSKHVLEGCRSGADPRLTHSHTHPPPHPSPHTHRQHFP